MSLYKTLRIKRLVAFVMVIVATGLEAQAAKVALQWDASPDSSVAGYRVYAKELPLGATKVMDVHNTTAASIDNLVDGSTYSIYLTAYTVAGVESDPSNMVDYTVPIEGFTLQFGGFGHGTATFSPRGIMSGPEAIYLAGKRVILNATAETGYACTGWTINSVFYPGNPGEVIMNQDSVVTPVMKKLGGTTTPDQPLTQISLKVSSVAGVPIVSVGGELGAWTLEGSSNLVDWEPVASGLTSDQLTMRAGSPQVFYRVRTATAAAR